MLLKEAKQLITEGVENKGWVGRSVANNFVRLNDDEDNPDPILLQALEEMLTNGELEQVPSAGQSRSTISYRKGTCSK